MKHFVYILLASMLVLAMTIGVASAQPYVDTVTFVHVGDAHEALEAVRNGTLDIYYYTIPNNLLTDTDGLKVYTVPAGGLLGLLLNPAEGERFNPFQISDVRFAVNYLVDRDGIVDDLLAGYGSSIISPFGPIHPDYTRTLEQVASQGIRYDPNFGRSMIHEAMMDAGAVVEDGVWHVDGEPVVVKMQLRDDDPIRLEIGNRLSLELEAAGFDVQRSYGDLAKAYDVVYSADPAALEWHIYTEGWGGGFSKYDDTRLATFYAPWRTNMPGGGNPQFWTYEHAELDRITQIIFQGDYTDEDHRTQLVREAVMLGIDEAVRLFLVAPEDTYIVNERITGVINHVSGGITHSMTLTNVQGHTGDLRVGMRLLSQSSWNPVAGFGDVYSGDISGPTGLSSAVTHPLTLDSIPLAVQRQVETAGPDGTLPVPTDVVRWDPYKQRWAEVGENVTATTVITMNYTFSNWHHGLSADINDILYQQYIDREWSIVTGDDDRTRDSELVSGYNPELDTLVGIRPIGDDSMEAYTTFWHADPDTLAGSRIIWTSIPWEILYAAERMVLDGKAAFSDTDALAGEVPWLSLIDADDAVIIREYLVSFLEEGAVPTPISGMDDEYYMERYRAAISWIDEHNHAYVGDGPFMLLSHDAEKAVLQAFRDESYPYPQGVWSHFGESSFPEVVGVSTSILHVGEPYQFAVYTTGVDDIQYTLIQESGGLVHTGQTDASGADTIIVPAGVTASLDTCSLTLHVVATSDDVIIPDTYEVGVPVANCGISLVEELERLDATEQLEFLRTVASVMDAAQDAGHSTDDILQIIDSTELGEAAAGLLLLILDGSISGDDLLEYIRP